MEKLTGVPANFTDSDHEFCMRICQSINRSRFCGHRDPGEFLSAAWSGWEEARTRYDPDKGASFYTYALRIIRGRVMDEIRKDMPYSRAIYAMLRKFHRLIDNGVSKTQALQEVTTGCQPSTKITFYAALMDNDSRHPETDEPMPSELDHVADHQAKCPTDLIYLKEAMHSVRHIMNSVLDWTERQVLEDIYDVEMRMRTVGNYMEISESRVSQIARDALGKVRCHMARSEAATKRHSRNNSARQAAERGMDPPL